MWQAFGRFKKDECSKTKEMLSTYIDQRLDAEELAHVEEHLSSCRSCRRELESLRATVALLHQLPEVTPSRSFAVAPVRPLPGRRALPALRFATAALGLLLVLAFAADGTNFFERKYQPGSYYGAGDFSADLVKADVAHWVVPGEMNGVVPDSEAAVNLVVPDNTDNVEVAVGALKSGGVLWGAIESVPDEVLQLVLTEGDEQTISEENIQEFAVVTASESRFATNDTATPFYGIMKEQVGSYLNVVSSDNNVLYSFDLEKARLTEVMAKREVGWLRPLEYGLIGLVAMLGGVTAALWLRQRRQRAAAGDASRN